MAVENTDIFLGSGASLTVVPELDFFFKPQTELLQMTMILSLLLLLLQVQ